MPRIHMPMDETLSRVVIDMFGPSGAGVQGGFSARQGRLMFDTVTGARVVSTPSPSTRA